jgi:hypothetical protein
VGNGLIRLPCAVEQLVEMHDLSWTLLTTCGRKYVNKRAALFFFFLD